VRQKDAAGDIWLSEGGGMMGKRDDSQAFFREAVERSTVGNFDGNAAYNP
jgi:hypothetical protein